MIKLAQVVISQLIMVKESPKSSEEAGQANVKREQNKVMIPLSQKRSEPMLSNGDNSWQ